jgi:hypothetical protein
VFPPHRGQHLQSSIASLTSAGGRSRKFTTERYRFRHKTLLTEMSSAGICWHQPEPRPVWSPFPAYLFAFPAMMQGRRSYLAQLGDDFERRRGVRTYFGLYPSGQALELAAPALGLSNKIQAWNVPTPSGHARWQAAADNRIVLHLTVFLFWNLTHQ